MKTELEIRNFLKECLSRHLKMEADRIEDDLSLDTHYGLESLDSLSIGASLEDWLGIELNVEVFLKYKTVAELARHVARLSETP